MELKTTNTIEATETTEIKVSKNVQDQATRIQGLMEEGKSLAEALSIIGTKTPRIQIDRVANIQKMDNLVDLRKARKTAYAKKSKSKDKPEAVERYQLEIDAATERINTLIASINAAEVPWKRALECGDTPDGALQYFVATKEDEISKRLEAFPMSKVQTKKLSGTFTPNDEFVPDELKESFNRRLGNRDQRLYTLAQRVLLTEGLEAGAVVLEDEKEETQDNLDNVPEEEKAILEARANEKAKKAEKVAGKSKSGKSKSK